MPDTIVKYEYELLKIDGVLFKQEHWEALSLLKKEQRKNFFRVEPDAIRFQQYVGVIKVGDLTLEIRPKADKSKEGSKDDKWQNVLVDMLAKCGTISISAQQRVHLKTGNLNLVELYFERYLDEIQNIVRQGLVKQYDKRSGNVNALKGKLIAHKHFSRNMVHKERFYTEHQMYNTDHEIHQLLLLAIKVVHKITTSRSIQNRCRKLELFFPGVANLAFQQQKIERIRLSRKLRGYTRGLELARLILLNYSPNVTVGNEPLISFLFDMNKLWEKYVAVRLTHYLSSNKNQFPDAAVTTQNKRGFWKRKFLKPDIIVTLGPVIIVIDTKWKIGSGKLSISDLRQVYTYAHFWKSKKVILLYPGNPNDSIIDTFRDDTEVVCIKQCVEVVSENGELTDDFCAHIMNQI